MARLLGAGAGVEYTRQLTHPTVFGQLRRSWR